MDHPGHSENLDVVYGVQGADFTRRRLLGKLRSAAIGVHGERITVTEEHSMASRDGEAV